MIIYHIFLSKWEWLSFSQRDTQIRSNMPVALYVNCIGQESTTLQLVPNTELSGPADIAIR